MSRSKKDVEEWYLSKFVSNKSLRLRVASILPMDPPDFKISRHIGKKRKEIGVEITRVINPNLKAEESAQEKIVRIAWEKFKAQYPDKLVVYVNFSRVKFSFTQKALNELAGTLFELVRDVVETNRGFEFRVETKSIRLNPVFEGVTIRNDDDYGFENWQPFGAFKVPYIDESWFGDIISKKEKLIPTYPEPFDEKWLVLVANFGRQSSHSQFSNLRDNFKDSPFDKIFVYKYREDQVIKIKY